MLYLAYGSNLHPLRLAERVPSAALQRTVSLDGWRLAFRKRGRDGSGKCDLVHSGRLPDRAYGALYRVDAAGRDRLDEHEGRGAGYQVHGLVLDGQGERINCFVYLAQEGHIDDRLKPYAWYAALVLLGARRLGLPADYIERLRRVPCAQDPDPQRRAAHERLIERIRAADERRT